MISERRVRRLQFSLLLAAGALLAFYWFAYRSVSGWARELDKPATEVWKKLLTVSQQSPYVRALDTRALEATVEQMRAATSFLEQAGQAAAARLGLEEEIVARVQDEFQLLEFERARMSVVADLQA